MRPFQPGKHPRGGQRAVFGRRHPETRSNVCPRQHTGDHCGGPVIAVLLEPALGQSAQDRGAQEPVADHNPLGTRRDSFLPKKVDELVRQRPGKRGTDHAEERHRQLISGNGEEQRSRDRAVRAPYDTSGSRPARFLRGRPQNCIELGAGVRWLRG